VSKTDKIETTEKNDSQKNGLKTDIKAGAGLLGQMDTAGNANVVKPKAGFVGDPSVSDV
jgi:hypothetical protein